MSRKLLTSISLSVQAVLAMTAFAAPHITVSNGDHDATMTSDFEASFINVSANCKASHSAFEAVQVAIEDIAPAVRSIHAEIETA